MHLLIPSISSLCTCVLLSCIVFTLLFGPARPPIFLIVPRIFLSIIISWTGWSFLHFIVATLSLELATSSSVFFIIALLDSPRYICVEICTPDRYFRAPLTRRAESGVHPFGRLHRKRETEVLGCRQLAAQWRRS